MRRTTLLSSSPSLHPTWLRALAARSTPLRGCRRSRCQLAVVDPSSFKLTSNRKTSCDNPELSGEPVVPIESVPHPLTQTGLVRISTYEPKTKTFHVGPVVLQFGNFSSSRPEWTYGDRSLWIFDAEGFTTGTVRNGRAVLLRVSLSSGRVLRRFNLPPMSRILLAADNNGLWFGMGNLSCCGPIETPKPANLYFIGNRASRPVVVSNKGLFLGWLVASGDVARAFFVTSVQTNAGEVDTFNSAREVTAVVHLGASSHLHLDIGEEDFDAAPVLTAQAYGLVFIWPLYSTAETTSLQVFIFDPATGHETRIATIPAPPYAYSQPNIVYDGSLYLLVSGEQGVNSVTLYRVQL